MLTYAWGGGTGNPLLWHHATFPPQCFPAYSHPCLFDEGSPSCQVARTGANCSVVTVWVHFGPASWTAIIRKLQKRETRSWKSERLQLKLGRMIPWKLLRGMDDTFVGRRIAQQPSANDFAVMLQTLFDGKTSPPHCLQKMLGHSQDRPPHRQKSNSIKVAMIVAVWLNLRNLFPGLFYRICYTSGMSFLTQASFQTLGTKRGSSLSLSPVRGKEYSPVKNTG